MEKEPVIAREVAEQEYQRMVECFGVEVDSESKETIIKAVMRGLIVLDEEKEELSYKLQRPVCAGETLSVITMHELTAAELEYVNRGFTVSGSSTKYSVDVSAAYTKIIRTIVKMSGCNLASAQRIKKRDLVILQALSDFFA